MLILLSHASVVPYSATHPLIKGSHLTQFAFSGDAESDEEKKIDHQRSDNLLQDLNLGNEHTHILESLLSRLDQGFPDSPRL